MPPRKNVFDAAAESRIAMLWGTESSFLNVISNVLFAGASISVTENWMFF